MGIKVRKKKMRNQKSRLQRNRIFLKVLLMTVMMLLVSAAAAIFLGNTVITSFYGDCGVFNASMDNLAVMTERQIIYQKKTLDCYAGLLQAGKEKTPQAALQKLTEVENQNFTALVFIDEDGNRYSTAEEIPCSEAAKQALAYLREHPAAEDSVYLGGCGEDTALYAVPCELADGTKGALAGVVPAMIKAESLFRELEKPGTKVYLLNEKQEVILYGGEGNQEFQYDSLDRRFFFKEFVTPLEQVKTLFGKWRDVQRAEVVERLLAGNELIWYEKQLPGEMTSAWKLVVSRPAVLSGDSAIIIRNSALLAAFIILFSFLLMLVLVVSQGISNRRLHRTAYIDAVTGEHNWTWFQLEAGRICSRKKRSGDYVMISMDIRKFRVISDVDGELQSDAVLKHTAVVLRNQLEKKERFSRFSVDEFAILLYCGSEREAVERVKKLDAALKSEAFLHGIEFCYGVYSITDYGMPIRKMYNYAGIARDCIKGSHEHFIGTFDDSMRETMVREKELESHMEHAMKQREFLVYLQPKYSADGSRIGGAEALVRWISPELGFLSPGEFIPLFEKNGFITKLDIYMLRSICELQEKWKNRGKELITISVNISRVHLMNPLLVQGIINMADAYGVPHRYIELEITESAFFEDKETLFGIVMQLQQAGFSVSMDDFGSGYSSLNSLKDLPLDVVKLDGEFFHYGNNRERSETVIRDTVKLAKHLNMGIVAEGIETKEQADFMHHIGCDYIQGYYFAKPMPVTEFEQLMGYQE